MKEKLTSRKFWLMAAAFLSSLGASIGGIATASPGLAKFGIFCAVLSAAIYSACEAYVDGKRSNSDGE